MVVNCVNPWLPQRQVRRPCRWGCRSSATAPWHPRTAVPGGGQDRSARRTHQGVTKPARPPTPASGTTRSRPRHCASSPDHLPGEDPARAGQPDDHAEPAGPARRAECPDLHCHRHPLNRSHGRHNGGTARAVPVQRLSLSVNKNGPVAIPWDKPGSTSAGGPVMPDGGSSAHRATQPRMSRLTSPGLSRCGKWPASGTITIWEPADRYRSAPRTSYTPMQPSALPCR